ncbi:MAG: radical SAM protein [Candidatus Scalindua sediminis]
MASNILLLSPNVGGLFTEGTTLIPPMGLLYMGAVLEKAGYNVTIADLLVAPEQDIDIESYNIIGITANTVQFNNALRFAEKAKKLGKTVILGGPHPTFEAEASLNTRNVDFIVRGEGEETIVELVKEIEGSSSFNNVKGISFISSGNHITHTPKREFIQDINSIPFPARHLINTEPYKKFEIAYKPAGSILTSRGCPFDCNFCVGTKMRGKKYRWRSVENIIEEIKIMHAEYGFYSIVFLDDNFVAKISRTRELCEEILRQNLDFKWWCMARTDILAKNPDTVELMAKAGCFQVFLGLESPNDEILESYNKHASGRTGDTAIKLLHKNGIRVHGSFIIGGLTETEEDILSTVKYAKKLKVDLAQFSVLTPYPGTALYNELKERIKVKDWDQYDCLHSVFDTNNLTTEQINKMVKTVYRKFYLSPERILIQLKGLTPKKLFGLIRRVKRIRQLTKNYA